MQLRWMIVLGCLAELLQLSKSCPTGLGGEEVTPARCHYGTLPGGWIRSEGRALLPWHADNSLNMSFPVWQPYCPKCQLKPLLTPYLVAADPEQEQQLLEVQQLGILLFGDSVDFRFVKYFCEFALGKEPEPFTLQDSDWMKLQGICETPKLTIAKQHISSASLTGPYWNDVDFSPLLAIPEGLEQFKKAHGRGPDIIGIASNFWDMASIFSAGGMRIAGTALEEEFLPDDFMRQWTQNFTTILSFIKERVPDETLLVYHTLHTPHQTSDPGMWETDAYLAEHVAQLNAVGRHVAQSQHFHILDIEAMAAQLSKGSVLVDNTHPGPDFMMQVLNILLNMEQAHKEALLAANQPSKLKGYFKWQREKLGERLSGQAVFKGLKGRRLLAGQ